MRLVAVAIFSSAAIAAPARAGVDDEQRARGHYEIGLGLYRLGDYHGALKEFAAGYELAHKPGFLSNLGRPTASSASCARRATCTGSFSSRCASTTRRDRRRRRCSPSSRRRCARSRPRRSPFSPRRHLRSRSSRAPPTPPTVAPAPAALTAAPPTVRASAPPPRPRRGLRIAGIVVGAVGLGLIGGGIGTAVAADGVARDLNAADRAGAVFDPAKDHEYSVDRALSAGFFTSGAILAAGGAVLVIVSAR